MIASVCAAQAPIERRPPQEAPVPTLKLESRLVTLAVNAVDESGSPVGGLDKPDFRLFEDGKEQKIAFFEKESATPLSIVLAIDGSESTLRNERLEKEAAKKFVNTLLRPQDELDLMEFADTVREIVAFTPSKQHIAEGLNDLRTQYVLGYYAPEKTVQSRADGFRSLKVEVTDPAAAAHVSLRYRSGYFATK